MKRILIISALCFIFCMAGFAQKPGGYAYMRVYDCNKSAGLGSGFIDSKIIIAYEDGTTEEVEINSFGEKEEPENLGKVAQTLTRLRSKGYRVVTMAASGEQGNMVTDYVLEKE